MWRHFRYTGLSHRRHVCLHQVTVTSLPSHTAMMMMMVRMMMMNFLIRGNICELEPLSAFEKMRKLTICLVIFSLFVRFSETNRLTVEAFL